MRAALALGSGGARGYAHIGAIQVLEERGFEIVSVAGSSMGALVGGLYAAGTLDEYAEWVQSLSQLDVLRQFELSLTAPGMFRVDKVFARMGELLGGALIEDLRVRFTAVATDLLASKTVWFQRGPVEAAVRASIAIPGVFTPVMLNGRVLVDGGISDPVPTAAIASARADVTIAVDLGGDRSGSADGSPARETAAERPVKEWAGRFRRNAGHLLDRDAVHSFLSHLRGAQRAGVDAEDPVDEARPEALPAGLGTLDVMNLSMEAVQRVVARYRLAGNPPDVLVTVPRDACRTLDFHRATEMIALGRTLTTEALDRRPA